MRSLFEINSDILTCIDTETGEVLDVERLEVLNMERDQKIEGVGMAIKMLNAEASAIREEEKALAERRQQKEKRAEALKNWLALALDGKPFETAKIRVSWRKSVATKVDDENGLIQYLMDNRHDRCYSVKHTINKAELSRMMKLGLTFPGVEIEERLNLQIK